MEEKRLKWVDIFKGILIILMVIGHSNNAVLIPWIYGFHMAAFFYIFGFTSQFKKYDFIDYLKKKFKSLMLPFFAVNIGFILLQFILTKVGIYSFYYDTPFSILSIVSLFKYFWTTDLGGATWFLAALFFSSIFAKGLYDILERSQSKVNLYLRHLGISFLAFCVFYYLFYRRGESIVYFLDLVPLGMFLISLGQFIKNYKWNIPKIIEILCKIGFVFIYVYFVGFRHYFIEISVRAIPNPVLFTGITLGGIVLVEILSKIIEKISIVNKVFLYIGKNTLNIMMYHFLSFRILFTIFYRLHWVELEELKNLTPSYNGFFFTLFTASLAVLLSLLLAKIIKWIQIYGKKVLQKLEQSQNQKLKTFLICFSFLILIFLFQSWVFSSRNFFIFDDYNNLATLPYKSFGEIITILPTDVYCSRSGGWVIAKLLILLFKDNYIGHAASMLFIHALNTIVFYLFCNKLLTKKEGRNTISIIASLIFSLYPISTFASFWEAGMFDLFGVTLTLIVFNLFMAIDRIEKGKAKKIIYITGMFIAYYISLRTKEMFIAVPVGLTVLSFINYFSKIKFKITSKEIKKYVSKNYYLFIMLFIMLFYFGYTRILNASSVITNDTSDFYYYTFHPLVLIKNLFAYIYIYFNTNSMVYGDVTSIIQYSNKYKVMIAILILVVLYVCYKCIKKKDFTYFIAIILFGVLILPVLPMANFRHILYLYAPSMFISLIVAMLLYKVFAYFTKNSYVVIGFVLLVLLATNFTKGVQSFREFWLSTAENDKRTYQYFLDLKESYPDIKNVYVLNVPEGYTSFYNGPGFIVIAAYQDNTIQIHINDENYDSLNSNQLVIDYNEGDYKIVSA